MEPICTIRILKRQQSDPLYKINLTNCNFKINFFQKKKLIKKPKKKHQKANNFPHIFLLNLLGMDGRCRCKTKIIIGF